MSALGSALDTIQNASALLDRTASHIAKSTTLGTTDGGSDSVSLSSDLTALLAARSAAAIGVKIAQTVDDLQRQALDVLG